MRPTLSAVLCVLGTHAVAGEGIRLEWKYEGHASFPRAAQEAKAAGKRLLVGLSGSPT